MFDDVVEQDLQHQILEERAVRTTFKTLEQLAAAGVYPDWDCVYGHAEFLVPTGERADVRETRGGATTIYATMRLLST